MQAAARAAATSPLRAIRVSSLASAAASSPRNARSSARFDSARESAAPSPPGVAGTPRSAAASRTLDFLGTGKAPRPASRVVGGEATEGVLPRLHQGRGPGAGVRIVELAAPIEEQVANVRGNVLEPFAGRARPGGGEGAGVGPPGVDAARLARKELRARLVAPAPFRPRVEVGCVAAGVARARFAGALPEREAEVGLPEHVDEEAAERGAGGAISRVAAARAALQVVAGIGRVDEQAGLARAPGGLVEGALHRPCVRTRGGEGDGALAERAQQVSREVDEVREPTAARAEREGEAEERGRGLGGAHDPASAARRAHWRRARRGPARAAPRSVQARLR